MVQVISMSELEFFMRKAVTRSSCARDQVGAVGVLKDIGIVCIGWNTEEDGLSCRTDCPRYKNGHKVIPGVTPYDSGIGKCIAMHAEEMALASLMKVARDISLEVPWDRFTLYINREPCYRCREMLDRAGCTWEVVDFH